MTAEANKALDMGDIQMMYMNQLMLGVWCSDMIFANGLDLCVWRQ
jgi:hypothetical protein